MHQGSGSQAPFHFAQVDVARSTANDGQYTDDRHFHKKGKKARES
jgi:hypothetical protein